MNRVGDIFAASTTWQRFRLRAPSGLALWASALRSGMAAKAASIDHHRIKAVCTASP
jgi:hypothetical protein